MGTATTIISQGVAANLDKIRAMTKCPTPRNIKQLRGFLDLTGYYRKFVAQSARIAQPLIIQLRKDKFRWNSATDNAFAALKKAMTSVPVLTLPDFTRPFLIETDTSECGLWVVLL